LETTAGLVLMGERAYLPDLGRFTSLDPVFGGGINAYNYANNDPINNNDPNGSLSQSVGEFSQSVGGFFKKNKETLVEVGIVAGVVVGVGSTFTAIAVATAKLLESAEPIAMPQLSAAQIRAYNRVVTRPSEQAERNSRLDPISEEEGESAELIDSLSELL
jgi:hypothetical protein